MALPPPRPSEADIIALARQVAHADGVAGLSERTVLGIGRADRHAFSSYAGERLVGYVQVWPEGTAELVVDPSHRRQGRGRRLWTEALEAGADSVWAHGDLPAAAAFARSLGLVSTRELLRMERLLNDSDANEVALPAGYRARAFVVGTDEPDWLSVNAAAFAAHPEQGRVTRDDLDRLMAQPWFDPADVLVVERTDRPGALVAFHWTKIPTDAPHTGRGEVYVVGIHPDHQGKGLAGPLTRLGLTHLARRGMRAVELYVEGTNAAARHTYEKAGFQVAQVDRVYATGGALTGSGSATMGA